MIKKRKILKIDLRRPEKKEIIDLIAMDKPINIFVNGEHFVTLIASPKNIRELAIGHLLGEGAITSFGDIEQITVKGVKVTVKTKNKIQTRISKFLRVIPTACGASEDLLEFQKTGAPRQKSKVKFKAANISNAFKLLQSGAKVFRKKVQEWRGGTN